MREKLKRKGVSFQRRGVLTCLMFVSPWLVGAAVFFLYPLFYSLRLSFGVIENPATQAVAFAGFENFRVAFMEDARFFPMLLSIAKDTLINTPLIVVFALFIATLLSKDIRGKGLFRSIFFLPVILGTGFVMQQLLGVQMNADAVEVAGHSPARKVVRFLNPGVTQVILEFLSRVTLVLWKSGVQIIIFLAGLQAIPRSFYEAARVDAATEWECFWFISLPMMAPTLLLGAVYTIVAGFLDTSNEMLGYIHELGFQWSQFEYASAVSWLYFLFVILVLAALFLLLNPATKRVREGLTAPPCSSLCAPFADGAERMSLDMLPSARRASMNWTDFKAYAAPWKLEKHFTQKRPVAGRQGGAVLFSHRAGLCVPVSVPVHDLPVSDEL